MSFGYQVAGFGVGSASAPFGLSSFTTRKDDGSSTISAPAGIQDGDLLLLFVCNDDAVTFTPPAGFTLVTSIDSGSTLQQLRMYKKTASGESGSYSYTTSPDGGFGVISSMLRISKAGTIQTNTAATASDVTTYDAPVIASATAGDLLLAVASYDYGSGGGPFTTPGSLTEVVNDGSTGGASGGTGSGGNWLMISKGILASSGATPSGLAFTSTVACACASIMVSISPA